jgi:hypothetical protein
MVSIHKDKNHGGTLRKWLELTWEQSLVGSGRGLHVVKSMEYDQAPLEKAKSTRQSKFISNG